MHTDISRQDLFSLSLLLLLPFIAFVTLSLFTTAGDSSSDRNIAYGLLLFLLYCSVLFIVTKRVGKQNQTIRQLEEQLSDERRNTQQLQQQFAENLEKRILDLQIANGALNREIAERTQAEEEVRELEKQRSLILNSAGEGILGLDTTGKVIFINQAATLMLGWESEEMLGNPHHELIHHTQGDGSPNPVEECPIYMAYRDGLVHYKTGDLFWCKNGTSFPVEYVSTPIQDRGMLTGAVVVFRDMNTFL